jgi:hypothetical protein
MAATTLTNSENFNPRTKHIAVRYMYINGHEREGVCKVRYLPTDSIPSDVLTTRPWAQENNMHTLYMAGYLITQYIWPYKGPV